MHKNNNVKRVYVVMKSSFNSSLKLDILVSLIDVVAFNIGLFICFHLGIWPTGGNDELLLFRWSAANISYFMSLCFIFITLHHRLRQPLPYLTIHIVLHCFSSCSMLPFLECHIMTFPDSSVRWQ